MTENYPQISMKTDILGQNLHLQVKETVEKWCFAEKNRPFELSFVEPGLHVAPTIIDIVDGTINFHSIKRGQFCHVVDISHQSDPGAADGPRTNPLPCTRATHGHPIKIPTLGRSVRRATTPPDCQSFNSGSGCCFPSATRGDMNGRRHGLGHTVWTKGYVR
jgi:hypothetical protein